MDKNEDTAQTTPTIVHELAGPPQDEVVYEGEESQEILDIELDFTDVSVGFEPLPIGRYQAVVSSVEQVAKSKQSGKPFLKFTFTITEQSEHAGRKLFDNYSLVKEARWKLARTLEALGYSVVGKRVGLHIPSVIGLPCQLVVSQGVYKHKITNEIEEVLPIDAQEVIEGAPAPF
ncbi:MAG: hypothetical protein AMJ88_13620 [Anaerolineae bacterium SM23_ 63]|nr:MAG: hypothetical protein AMJ88_13620 [Anaerolineae bacterium SM23_ 63]